MRIKLGPATALRGNPLIPGDKSISHRALIFGAMAHGPTTVHGLLDSADVRSTWACLESLGVSIRANGGAVRIDGTGTFRAPGGPLDAGNSGTTVRLMAGVLAGQNFGCTINGDASLGRRPMARVTLPLSEMGAGFRLRDENFLPMEIMGAPLRAIRYRLPVASAQLKSALILAGLGAQGSTELVGEIASRDHTERLLPHFGAKLSVDSNKISLAGGQRLHGAEVFVPGDPSTAAFWIAGASLVSGAEVLMENILLNPTRTGIISVLRRMGADITEMVNVHLPEPVGTLRVRAAPLVGTTVNKSEVASLIDEIPLLAVVACFARGRTEVRGANELRVKESDRLNAVAVNLRAMGAKITTFDDGFAIEGPQKLRGSLVMAYDDHRIAMSFAIAALMAEGETEIEGADSVAISYPKFFDTLHELTAS